jgi:hypothetical protein
MERSLAERAQRGDPEAFTRLAHAAAELRERRPMRPHTREERS